MQSFLPSTEEAAASREPLQAGSDAVGQLLQGVEGGEVARVAHSRILPELLPDVEPAWEGSVYSDLFLQKEGL